MGLFSKTVTEPHVGPGGGAQGSVEKAFAPGYGWRALIGGHYVGEAGTRKEALAIADREAARMASGERE